MYTIEIAVTDFHTASAAVQGGADRIELCTALSEGGLTPAASLIRLCRERFSVPLFPIIRPRPGDFLYDKDEFSIMKADVLLCRELGCDGVVLGALQQDGDIDQRMAGTLREMAYPMDVTFHRAFDRCRDPHKALEDLVELGFQRILTSGQQLLAIDALPLLHELVREAGERIIILPGSGIRPYNILQVAEATGAREFHSSLSTVAISRMAFQQPAFIQTSDELLPAVDPADVQALRAALYNTKG